MLIKKRYFAFILVLICSSATAQDYKGKVRNYEAFSLKVPKGWKVKEIKGTFPLFHFRRDRIAFYKGKDAVGMAEPGLAQCDLSYKQPAGYKVFGKKNGDEAAVKNENAPPRFDQDCLKAYLLENHSRIDTLNAVVYILPKAATENGKETGDLSVLVIDLSTQQQIVFFNLYKKVRRIDQEKLEAMVRTIIFRKEP